MLLKLLMRIINSDLLLAPLDLKDALNLGLDMIVQDGAGDHYGRPLGLTLREPRTGVQMGLRKHLLICRKILALETLRRPLLVVPDG